MDIRKLQRAIVDGLEDVKAQNIVVFNTEALSPLFERVIIASGTSNRQTKALAASVRDSVKGRGMQVLRTEGEDNGEWIIVDCGAAVAHIMQPAVRDYYHLEEIWGGKTVGMKLAAEVPARLVKASSAAAQEVSTRKPAAKYTTRGGAGAPAKSGAKKAAPRRPATDRSVVGRTSAPRKSAVKVAVKTTAGTVAKRSTSNRSAAKRPAAKTATKTTAAKKTTRRA